MSGALALVAAWFGFAFLAYAAKGSNSTQWQGTINPGPIIKQMALGHWPYQLQLVGSSPEGPVPIPKSGPFGSGGKFGPASTSTTTPGTQIA